ncbi:hydrogen gas-evolving membrane-bound hydrogenase subunit E [Actinoalloteichus hymeniacidonis]|uniref:NADH dehydrogenase (Quinone) n=1 Tax=Actinoalloteichus hymeniacidonis TaxID=340345 RepID=A0AAC9N164_9PSEU|nr:hydrogen gas-evolving membrane-bound hydrogenase subunit E [Actinoalloteichus hymeniacidonis]AOS65581.1 NADH dehydrogenase (quinone) [Actinoalloteichus hymeniacidonis]MBB5906329.1 multicomponent Na+:H+ antiporter subunit A [Actinoalloteichus hymeniacidonis]
MLLLVTAHLVLAALLPLLVRRLGRWAFAVAAVLPALTLAWSLSRLSSVLADEPVVQTFSWAPSIGLEMVLRLDVLSMLMIFLVSGLGALILAYCVYYFGSHGEGIGRTSALLLAFAGAMFGLVVADDLISLYIFWELTTVCSFLLVGQDGVGKKMRRSSVQALLVTVFGGLTMLMGVIMLGHAAGTFRISEIVADPPSGTGVSVAVVLVLVGAFTKSAQMPFHPWLPGAMVAPTPVSAYLHAASMVKAGVYLVARLAPAFGGLTSWWLPIAVIGIATMLIGGVRALYQHDLKTMLAYGTVSQLGFLMVLTGGGTYIAAIAGVTMLLAHGLFKAALFLVVGIVDHQAGTRDIRKLSGLGRRFPGLAALAVIAAGSMAGIPPLLGFIGKEAAFEAFAHQGGARGVLVLIGLVLGSVLTVAYSIRLVWGAFGDKPGVTPSVAPAPSMGLVLPAAIPALAGLVLGLWPAPVETLVAPYAAGFPSDGEAYHLALWHGFNLPLLLSAVVVVLGLGVWWFRERTADKPAPKLPHFLHAQTFYDRSVLSLEVLSYGVTGRLQVGSLPTYLGIILLTMLFIPGTAVLTGTSFLGEQQLWHSAAQVPLAVLVCVGAIALTMVRQRLTAVLLTGGIGYAIGALFVVDGGPDLALAQFLVETLTLVAFVFVLRKLPARFTQIESAKRLRWPKVVISVAAGAFVAVATVIFSGARQAPPTSSEEFISRAEDGANATNVVNAILVDFRAFDTVGEITVLAVAATGVASLILAVRRTRTPSPVEVEEQTVLAAPGGRSGGAGGDELGAKSATESTDGSRGQRGETGADGAPSNEESKRTNDEEAP